MPPRYFLRCLGSPELLGPGGEPVRFRTRKHLALLTFLAVERRDQHRRDRLADLLWPEARPAEGRHSLATALSVIRGKLGPRTFESTRDTVRLVAPELDVDLERLARGDILGDEAAPPLEVAGFLEEFEVGRAPEYMLWRDLMRARWFPQIREALVLLMDRCRRTGDFARIGPHADRLLALDELSEEAIRAKMEACAFAGDRISAIRIFQSWKTRLTDELDAAPSPLVEGMALRLRQRSYEPPGSAHIPTVPTDQWRNRAFVGRASQYRALYERWEEANAGRGRHGLVLGDSGIGKTTLVERLTTAAGLEGAVSSRVQCYDVEREIPYSAVGTLVRGLLDRPGAGCTPPEWLAELATCSPAVAQRYANLPPPRESAGENARLRLTEAVHALATAVAEEQPAILVVDDVHLADDASVAVLHLLMRRTQNQRIMVIMTARQAELGNSPHAGRLIENRDSLGLEAIELPPLTDDEMHEVITALAAAVEAEMSPAVRRALVRSSAGVPMIMELLFDDWRAHGDECLALSVGAMTVDAMGQDQRELYHRVFDRTFRMLSDPARSVLNLAAILGERLNDLTMYSLADLSLAQTLAGMAELERHRVLRDGGRDMEFRNESLRGYAYLSVPSPLRRALHGLIADRLLLAEANGDHVPELMLAWHCFRAARPASAEPYLLRGARGALRKGGAFEVELALTSAMKGITESALKEARLILAEAFQEQDRHLEALALLCGNANGGQSDRSEVQRRVLEARSRSELITSNEEAGLVLETIEEILSTELPVHEKISVVESAQFPLYFLGDQQRATQILLIANELQPAALEIEDKARIARSVALSTWLSKQRSEIPRLCDHLRMIAEECQSAGVANLSAWCLYVGLGCLQLCLGRYAECLENNQIAFRIACKVGNRKKMAGAAINAAICSCRLGNYPQQVDWTQRAIHCLEKDPIGWTRHQAGYYQSLGLCLMGENVRGLEEMERLNSPGFQAGSIWIAQVSQLMMADICMLAGEDGRANKYAASAFASCGFEPLADGYTGMVARWLAKATFLDGDDQVARRVLDRLYREVERYDLLDQAEILGARSQLASKLGEKLSGLRDALRETLLRLPPAVETQLKRLGAGR